MTEKLRRRDGSMGIDRRGYRGVRPENSALALEVLLCERVDLSGRDLHPPLRLLRLAEELVAVGDVVPVALVLLAVVTEVGLLDVVDASADLVLVLVRVRDVGVALASQLLGAALQAEVVDGEVAHFLRWRRRLLVPAA